MEASLARTQNQTSAEAQLSALYDDGVVAVYRELLRLTGGDRQHAEDLTQETFMRALHQLRRTESIPAGSPEARTHPTVGWLVVVARHLFIDEVRRSGRQRAAFAALARFRTSSVIEPDWDAVSTGTAIQLLGRLGPEHRCALVLHHVHGMPTKEVAALLGRSERATESLLVRSRKHLARLVNEQGRSTSDA